MADGYEEFCGPQALHALLDESPGRARPPPARCAAMLLAIQQHRGRMTAPGTSESDMALALTRHGLTVTPHDPRTGQPTEDPTAYAARLRKEIQQHHQSGQRIIDRRTEYADAARDLIESAPTDQQPGLWKHWRDRHRDHLRLRDWRRPGDWLLAVDTDAYRHWLAMRDQRIVAGGDGYGKWAITVALHIHR